MKHEDREIKFRAKIKGDAGVYHVWAIDWLYQRAYIERACGDEWVPFDKIQEFMQYTGLKDRNGVEGYAGDKASESGSVWVITWNDSEGCWKLENDIYPPLPIRKLKGMIILGNIYESPLKESPELLDEQEARQ